MSGWFRTYGFADVLEGLVVGAYPLDRDDVAMLEWLGIERVLNLSEDREYPPGNREAVIAALAEAGIDEQRVEFVDFGGLPPQALEEAVAAVLSSLEEGKRTYLHCRAGWQRAAAVAAGVVALRGGVDVDQALALVQQRKPSADPLPNQRDDLRRWWDGRGAAARSTPRPGADGP
jgi:protein-tyrosine phosphatase